MSYKSENDVSLIYKNDSHQLIKTDLSLRCKNDVMLRYKWCKNDKELLKVMVNVN